MNKLRLRMGTFLLAALILSVSVFPGVLPVYAAAPEYQNTYVNTGNQRADIIGVALTQLGYTEGNNNDTKYGAWNNLPYQPWCASFVSWCARQADISTDILAKSGLANPKYFDIPYYHGSRYTPKPGDLFFSEGFSHVGLVYKVEGNYFYSLEGNGSDDFSYEGYYVIMNKRSISRYYFGVPNYEGTDGGHEYVKGQDSAHPHKTYYACQTCGDKYYTGYTAIEADCGKCFGCGCSESQSGYYLVDTDGMSLKVWDGHSRKGKTLGQVPDGAVVYAYGGTSSGWMHIEYDGLRGHVSIQNLDPYYAAPDAPVISTDKPDYVWGDDVAISWNRDPAAEEYRLEIRKDGETLVETDMGTTRSYTLEAAQAGVYEVVVSAANLTGWSQAGSLMVTVRDTYTVSYDAAGGSGAPLPQTVALGTPVTLTSEVPLREGFTFLGWTDEAEGCFAGYHAGETLLSDKDMTLYAVWKEDSAAPQSLEILHLPQRTMFLQNEELNTTGLTLSVNYSDGSGRTVTEGFTAEGFSSETLGSSTVTITFEGLTVTYDVQIVTAIPGDINGDCQVTRDDVMQLLWHITFPEEFPIDAFADFSGDGLVDRDDVMQLLWHITFPAEFPLNAPAE